MSRRSSGGGKTGRVGLLLMLALQGCGVEPKVITGCEPADGITPICGFHNPEDLAPLPGAGWIAVSEYGGNDAEPGALVAYRVSDGRKLPLFPDSQAGSAGGAGPGAADCPGPPDPARFSPHGIDVDLRAHRLAAVNHGGREAVELFSVGRSARGPVLSWQGCVPLPEGVWPNDVALLANGGFVVTQMLDKGGLAGALSLVKLVAGLDTGRVLEWLPASGFREVPSSGGRGPNGVVATPNGREIYFAEWTGSRLVRLRLRDDGAVQRDEVVLPHRPDNVTWTRDGRLLVTGQVGRIGDVLGCRGVPQGTCALPFSVVLVDPVTLDVRTILEHPATAQGAGTVALEVGDQIFVGTFDGDRLGRASFRP